MDAQVNTIYNWLINDKPSLHMLNRLSMYIQRHMPRLAGRAGRAGRVGIDVFLLDVYYGRAIDVKKMLAGYCENTGFYELVMEFIANGYENYKSVEDAMYSNININTHLWASM